MTGSKDPNRLHLRKVATTTSYLICYKKRCIGTVESVPVKTTAGIVSPPILLMQPFSEALKDRIRDLVNRRDGTNRDIQVFEAPRRDHPAIIRHKQRMLLKW